MFLVFLFEVVVFVFLVFGFGVFTIWENNDHLRKAKNSNFNQDYQDFFGLCIGRLHNKEEMMTIYREPNSKVIENIFKHMLFVVQSLINDKCA